MSKLKRCTACAKQKRLNEFFSDKTRKDGLDYYCKQCRKKIYMQYYEKNRDVIIAKMHERNQKYKKA